MSEKRKRRDSFADESFWRELEPFLFSAERIEAAEEEIEKLLKLVSLRGTCVLDLCCGPGRHSVAMAKRGLRVTGVDRTPYLLDKARKRARGAKVKVEWVRSDMRDFVRRGAFDLAVNLWTSFGYFERKQDDLKVLKNVHRSLKPGGVFVMELRGKERIARDFQSTTSHEVEDGSLLVERHEVIEDWSRLRNEWILIKGNRARRFKFDLRIYSGLELKDSLLRAGFARVKLFGDFDGNEYGADAKRLIAVARKK